MGVGGNFWDLLKPYARSEGFDYLRGKRVAVDLSFWIVQHETAIKARVRNPHLRLTFFRTINLFSKFGAFPVFVADGTPSPLKSQARISRFFHATGIDLSSLPVADEGVSVDRNATFLKCVKECVELLELLGMPVLTAKGEAEALCAQLNREGYVDACITADSDAFLFGAKSVIKCIRPNFKEPIECYNISDIEAGLGLKRSHLIAISLLVGNDHDLNGVPGVGLDTALRFVQTFSEDNILTRLHEIGKGETLPFQGCSRSTENSIPSLDERSPKTKSSHCSLCGHPGRKRDHLKFSCKYCGTVAGCKEKPDGFRCHCSSCDMDQKAKEQKKQENWQIRICNKIATKPNFPNDEIIEMYMCNSHGYFTANEGPDLSWESPKTEMLVDYLGFHQHWEPSYIRQRMLPMLSAIYLTEMASNPVKKQLYGQYEFDSIQRVKVRLGQQFYVIKWKKAASSMSSAISIHSRDSDMQQEEIIDVDECVDILDESNGPQIHVDASGSFILTDENMELVSAAFPEQVDRFLQEKELRKSKTKKSSNSRSEGTSGKSESTSVQLSIKEFYRSAKAKPEKSQDDESSEGKRKKESSSALSKSARRRLLFN